MFYDHPTSQPPRLLAASVDAGVAAAEERALRIFPSMQRGQQASATPAEPPPVAKPVDQAEEEALRLFPSMRPKAAPPVAAPAPPPAPAQPAAATQVPEAYAFSVPDDLKHLGLIDDPALAELYSQIATESGLSQAAAQRLLEVHLRSTFGALP